MILDRCCVMKRSSAVLLVAALIVLARQSDEFFTADNLLNQGRLMAEVGLVALPMTFVIVTGGIDLSVGSIFGLCRDPARRLLAEYGHAACRSPWSPRCWSAASPGSATASSSPASSVPPLIATLATLALYRGLAEGISQARSVRGYPDWFFVFGQGDLLGVPTQLWILVIWPSRAAFMLGLTTFGRTIYAIGSNEVGGALLRPPCRSRQDA